MTSRYNSMTRVWRMCLEGITPISNVVPKGKVTEDYSLSPTDLSHSLARTIQLSLSQDTSFPIDSAMNSLLQSTTS